MKPKNNTLQYLGFIALAGFSTFGSQSAQATDYTWTGGTSTDWEDSANWGGTQPVSTDNAVFTGTFTNQPTLTANTVTTGGLWMTGTLGQSVTVSGAFNLNLGGNIINGISGLGILIDNTDARTLTISSNALLQNAQEWRNASGNLFTLSGLLQTNGKALTLSNTGAGGTTVSGLINGAGAITINNTGAGVTTFSNTSSTYSGQLTVQSGTLKIDTANGTSVNGELGNNALSVILGGSGAQTGTLEYTGATASSSKKFTMATGGTGAFQIDSSGANLTLSGLIDGSGAVTKTGSGTLTLTGTNTYAGGTTISAGTVALTTNNAGFGTGTVAIGASGTVNLTFAGDANIANVFTGTGTITVAGSAGTPNFTNASALNGFTGTLNVNTTGGRKVALVTAGEKIGSGATVNITSAGTLYIATTTASFDGVTFNVVGSGNSENLGAIRIEAGSVIGATSSVVLGGNTSLGSNSGTGTINAAISQSTASAVTKVGAGTLVLGGSNTYTGTTTISAGTLQLGNGTTDGSIANASNVTNNATLNFNNVNALTYTGNITGGSTGILTKTGAGTLTLGGTNTVKTLNVNANTTIDIGAGSLTLSNLGASTLQSTTGGTINGTGGGTIVLGSDLGDIGTANGTTLTINAAITGTSANTFEVYGGATGGTVVLANNANTFGGNVQIDGGTLSVANIGNTGSTTSNLGAGTTIFMSGASTQSVLKYTGTGETTNRIISLFGTTAGATLDQSGTGNLNFSANFATPGAGNKVLTLQGSTAGTGVISGNIIDNSGTNKTGVTKVGTGTWTLSGTGNTYSNGTRANAGTLIISGSVVSGGFVSVNNVGAQNATLKVVSGATLGMNDFNIGEAASSRAAVFQSGGAITVNNNTGIAFRLGNNTNSYGYYNMSGGTLDLAGAAGEFNVGGGSAAGQSAVGVMDVSGGTITTKSWILLGRGDAGTAVSTSSGLLNITGGSISHTSNQIALAWAEASGATSILNVGGGGGAAALTGYNSAATSGAVGINLASTSITGQLGAVNLLTNGTLTVSMVQAGGANTETLLNFNGGTLKATATNAGASFLTAAQNLDAVHVYGGGGTIDNNGTAITIGKALQTTSGTGITTIAVTDGGAGYIGAPLVEISGGTGSTATAYANMVDDGTGNGTFKIGSITVTSNGVYSVAPTTVTLTGGGATTAATLGAITTGANVTSGGMTFAGTGTTTLTGANTYNGTTINAGTVTVGTGGTLGATTGALAVNNPNTGAGTNVVLNLATAVDTTVGSLSGTIATPSGGTNTATINSGGSGRNFTVNQTTAGTYAGVIAGAGSFTLGSSSTNALTLSGSNTYTGATTISAGTLTLSNALALQNSALDTTNSIVGTSTAGLKTTVTTLTLGGLTGNKDLASVFTTTSGGYSAVTALTLNPGTGVTNAYTGVIANGTAGMTLTKTGLGTQTLSGTNTYTGATNVNSGKLVVGVGGAGSLTSNVNVASAAILGGSGTINGSVTLAAESGVGLKNGGTLAPGNSPGTLTVTGSTTFNTGSIFEWDIDSSLGQAATDAGTGYDSVKTASLSGPDGVFKVVLGGGDTFGSTFWDSAHDWTNIFSTDGTTANALNIASIFSSFSGTGVASDGTVSGQGLFTFTGGGSTLTWSAVPEPTTALSGLLLTAGLLRRRRKN